VPTIAVIPTGGYVGFCEMDKPWSIPPNDVRDYNYAPVPLKPLPPMPAEVFLHYFQYGDSHNVHKSGHWLQRLPKKLKARITDAPEVPVWGCGIYIVEGPNRPVIFWITSILAAILWSSLREDSPNCDADGYYGSIAWRFIYILYCQVKLCVAGFEPISRVHQPCYISSFGSAP
jgi:hypothetical protein